MRNAFTRVGALSLEVIEPGTVVPHIFDSMRLLDRKKPLEPVTLSLLQDAAESCDTCRSQLDLLLNCLACGH
jgi:hypothetical protein